MKPPVLLEETGGRLENAMVERRSFTSTLGLCIKYLIIDRLNQRLVELSRSELRPDLSLAVFQLLV